MWIHDILIIMEFIKVCEKEESQTPVLPSVSDNHQGTWYFQIIMEVYVKEESLTPVLSSVSANHQDEEHFAG